MRTAWRLMLNFPTVEKNYSGKNFRTYSQLNTLLTEWFVNAFYRKKNYVIIGKRLFLQYSKYENYEQNKPKNRFSL